MYHTNKNMTLKLLEIEKFLDNKMDINSFKN